MDSLRIVVPLRLDSKPQRIERRQEKECQQSANPDTTNENIGERSPEAGERQRDKGQHSGQGRQNDRTGTAHRRLDNRVVITQTGHLIMMDLVDKNQRVSHQDT